MAVELDLNAERGVKEGASGEETVMGMVMESGTKSFKYSFLFTKKEYSFQRKLTEGSEK